MTRRFSHERANAMRAGKASARQDRFENIAADASELAENAGRHRYSRAAGKLMKADTVKKIDPKSPEGRAIIEGLKG